jgi:hypothetical protein
MTNDRELPQVIEARKRRVIKVPQAQSHLSSRNIHGHFRPKMAQKPHEYCVEPIPSLAVSAGFCEALLRTARTVRACKARTP